MQLLTKELEKKLPALYSQDGNPEAKAIAKFFTPDSNSTWYASEYDPETRTFFGLVDGFEKELGYFTLDELESVRGGLGLPVERDRWFTPTNLQKLVNRHRTDDK